MKLLRYLLVIVLLFEPLWNVMQKQDVYAASNHLYSFLPFPSCMGNIPVKADKEVVQKVIVRVAQNVKDKDYVMGYKRLLLFKDFFTEEYEKFFYHIYMAQVLHEAIHQSAAPEYRDDYHISLKYVTDYYLNHQHTYASADMAFCWTYVERLADVFYESGEEDELKQLVEKAGKVYRASDVKRSDVIYHINMKYYLMMMKKGMWAMAGLHANSVAFMLAEGKADANYIGRAFEYAALGHLVQGMSAGDFTFLEGMTREMMTNAMAAYSKQDTQEGVENRIFQLGYEALLHQLEGEHQQAIQCIEKEEKQLMALPGADSNSEAWMLFQRSMIEETSYHRKEAVATMEKAFSAMLRSKHFDSVRRELIIWRYEAQHAPDMALSFTDNTPKSISYYQNQLAMVLLSAMSNADRLKVLNRNMVELQQLHPFPANLYLKYLMEEVEIRRSSSSNEEFVALPSDYEVLKQDDTTTPMVDEIVGKGEKGVVKLELLAALDLLSKAGGNHNGAIADIMLQLGEMMMDEKDYKGAQKVLAASQMLWGNDEDQQTGRLQSLALMAKCMQMLDEHNKCRMILKQLDAEIDRIDVSVRRSVGYVSLLNYMADVYVELGEKNKAKECSDMVVGLSKNSFRLLQQSHEASYRKALLMYADGHYRECADLLMEICPADRNMIHFELYYAVMIKSLCRVADPKAVYFYREFSRRSLDEILPVFISRESQFSRDVMWAYKSSILMQLGAEVCATFPDKGVASLAFDNTVFCKSLDLRMNESLRQFVRQSDNDFVQSTYRNMLDAQDSLHYASQTDVMRYKNRISFAQQQLLGLMVEEQKKTHAPTPYTYIFSRSLGENMALVEYSMYEADGEQFYCAYVMKRGMESPLFVKLCKASDLKQCIDGRGEKEIDRIYNTNELYQLIWKPISEYMDEAKIESLLITPTGLINRINLDFIHCGTYRLADRYNVMRLTTSASLMDAKKFHFKLYDTDVALFGNLKYDMSESEMQQAAVKYPSRSRERLYRTSRESDLRALPFSGVELEEVKRVFGKTELRISEYTGKEGTEEAFKQFDGRAPLYMHLATHGFYLKDQSQKNKHSFYNDFTAAYYSDKPLLYSGLLMAGAAKAWRGEKLSGNTEDGILTADEISRMDLSRTRLVVLSACETALGDIDETEGVVGLQRAFKKAGADFVVMSLWKVKDDVSTLFMKEFYNALLEKKMINQAVRDAAYKVKENYPSVSDWAAFVVQR